MENQQLMDYRKRLLEALLAAVEEFCAACRAVADPFRPIEASQWNVHQVAVHVRDVDAQVYGLRARRTVQEYRPTFQNFDEGVWMKAHYDPGEPMAKVLDEFAAGARDLAASLGEVPAQAWGRVSRHEIDGERTMQAWVERGLAHIQEHLATVRRAQ